MVWQCRKLPDYQPYTVALTLARYFCCHLMRVCVWIFMLAARDCHETVSSWTKFHALHILTITTQNKQKKGGKTHSLISTCSECVAKTLFFGIVIVIVFFSLAFLLSFTTLNETYCSRITSQSSRAHDRTCATFKRWKHTIARCVQSTRFFSLEKKQNPSLTQSNTSFILVQCIVSASPLILIIILWANIHFVPIRRQTAASPYSSADFLYVARVHLFQGEGKSFLRSLQSIVYWRWINFHFN